jgi:hypothetical protein
MSNANAATTVWNLPNLVGELFLIGQNATPFLNMIGGVEGGNAKVAKGWIHPVSLEYSLEAASQPAITETASLTAPTAWTYVPAQTTNVCQIFQKSVSASYSAMSDNASLGTLNAAGTMGAAVLGEDNPIADKLSFQLQAALKQIARDLEYTYINGAYQISTAADVANKMRGLVAAITTNAVTGGAAALSKAMIDSAMKKMADAGAPFTNPVIMVNSFQKQKLSSIYGYAPMDRTVGGLNIEQIETDFARMPVMFVPNVPAATLVIADLAYIHPVFLPVPKKGLLFYEELARTGAGVSGQVYGQIGLAYGPETYHAKITGLATS